VKLLEETKALSQNQYLCDFSGGPGPLGKFDRPPRDDIPKKLSNSGAFIMVVHVYLFEAYYN
jgi:hypothetical protein